MEHPGKKRLNPIVYALVVASVFALLAVPFLLEEEEAGSIVYSRVLMGTTVEITLWGGDEKVLDRAAGAAFTEIARLEDIFSSYRPGSDVSRVSRNAGKGPVEVSPEVVEVVQTALRISEISGGAFDPTVGALAGLWGWSGESGVAPPVEEVEGLLPLVDYRKVSVDRAKNTVELEEPGMVLNLGGVAKGYIVSKAIEKLKAGGAERGIIKAGGDLAVFQTRGRRPFVIGIKHPREEASLMGRVEVVSGAVTTSGDYERYFIEDGVRYHHILDPSTGYPARGTMSVTVVAEEPVLADALSTAVFVMGSKEGLGVIEGFSGVEAVVVDSDGTVHTSTGFRGTVRDHITP